MATRSAILKRLPVLLIAGLGLWLWRGGGGLLPSERTLTWRLWGDYAAIRKVELQLWDSDNVLLKREELSYPQGVALEPTQHISLRPGRYTARTFIWRAGAPAAEQAGAQLAIADEEGLLVLARPAHGD